MSDEGLRKLERSAEDDPAAKAALEAARQRCGHDLVRIGTVITYSDSGCDVQRRYYRDCKGHVLLRRCDFHGTGLCGSCCSVHKCVTSEPKDDPLDKL